jgi:hypothetical protein
MEEKHWWKSATRIRVFFSECIQKLKNMDNIVKEFRTYLQTILDAHSNTTVITAFNSRLASKKRKLEIFTVDYNKKSIDRAVEILSKYGLGADREKIRIELSNCIREYSKKFLDANFSVG